MTVPRMHDDEVDVGVDLVRAMVLRDRPDLGGRALTRLRTWGTDHVIFRLGDDLAVRVPKIGWAAGQGDKERTWLPLLAAGLPVEVPVPIFVGGPSASYPHRWCISPWIEGVPVDPATVDLGALATDLAEFVLALESIDVAGGPGPLEGQRGGLLAQADAATRASAEQLRGDTDVDALLAAWPAGVDAAPWHGPARWVHGDLMDGNLLLRQGRLAAVIDWGGLTVGDPAVELMIAWSLMDRESRQRYRDALGFVDQDMWLRGRAWATSAAVMALPYYRTSNPDIVARSWRAVQAVVDDIVDGG